MINVFALIKTKQNNWYRIEGKIQMNKRNIFITGATGFIGKRLLEELVETGNNVTAIVRDKEKLSSEVKEKITIIECPAENFCLLDKNYLPKKELNNGVFFHFLWEGTSGSSRGDEKQQLQNIEYACEALKLAIRLGCSRFVNAGSIMEYEAMKNIPEERYRLGRHNLYAVSKLTADFYLKILAANLNIEYINVIISNVYGPGERSRRFLNTTLRKMMNNETVFMTEGLQQYDFIYVEDAVKAIKLVGLFGEEFTSYYIGNRRQYPLRKYVLEMKKILKSQSEIKFGETAMEGQGLSYKEFDTTALEKLGFKAVVSFEEGIVRTKNWILKMDEEKDV